jgi:transglutaminase-like putative cysteine protease
VKYRIKHITEYKYASAVSHCYNHAQLIPRDTSRQTCLQHNIQVTPAPSYSAQRSDYFGNTSYHFEIQRPHTKLVITATSEVETNNQSISVDMDFGISCADIKQQLASASDAATVLAQEYIMDSPFVKNSSELAAYAAPLFDNNKPFLSAVMALTTKIFTEFEYSPNATTVATPLSDVFKKKHGVCQDFAHLQIACLRSLGYPARYVSGYIETLPAPGEVKLVGSDASHAWIAVYSPLEGWVEFDPTNNCLAHEQHIATAWGRDYFDITPLKGVIYGGGGKPILSVSVDVARV